MFLTENIAFLIVVVGVNMSTDYFYLLMHMPFLVILMCRDHSYCLLIHVHRNAFVMSVLTYLFYFIYIILDVLIVVIDHCSDFSIACDRLCYATPHIAHSVF